MLVFEERKKLKYPEKNLSDYRQEPTSHSIPVCIDDDDEHTRKHGGKVKQATSFIYSHWKVTDRDCGLRSTGNPKLRASHLTVHNVRSTGTATGRLFSSQCGVQHYSPLCLKIESNYGRRTRSKRRTGAGSVFCLCAGSDTGSTWCIGIIYSYVLVSSKGMFSADFGACSGDGWGWIFPVQPLGARCFVATAVSQPSG